MRRLHAALAVALLVMVGCGTTAGGPSGPPVPPSVGSVAGTAVVGSGAVSQAATSVSFPVRPERRAGRRLYAPDQVVIGLRPGAPAEAVRALHSQVGARVRREVSAIGIQTIQLPSGADIDRAVAAYRASPWVRFVERNAYVYPTATPNDPLYGTHQWHYPAIQLPAAWDATKGSPVVVAVVDTGIRFDHPDLAGLGVPGWDFGDGDPDATDPGCPSVDPTEPSHGTHVAGTVAALTDNGVGVAGVVWGGATAVRVMSVRVLGEDVVSQECAVGTTSDLAAAVVFAADNGAKVINMSLGGPYSSAVDLALSYAYSRGVVLVAAAGNDGGAVSFPAWHPNVIAVAATACD
ncbi:MAG: S8 family serine peptidase, partial [Firmicutes bacterium]|nr:S8 family serine peptidase [Bacillota bacterium]